MRVVVWLFSFLLVFVIACNSDQKSKENELGQRTACLEFGSNISKEYNNPYLKPYAAFLKLSHKIVDSGFFLVPQNEWSYRYEPNKMDTGVYKIEDNVWYLCDLNRNITSDELGIKNSYSCVFRSEKGDMKLTALYYSSAEVLKRDKEKLKYISRYILCTDGLKQPNRIINIKNWAFIFQTRSVMSEEIMFKVKKVVESYHFIPPNS